ncbi:reverse transcriptase [Quillaja saponaria]|uniref:Reverse transcriptase n=1 Tax=Quillaja saponaria TaxID=32244 RepID=A0AAD7Q135_QUISA|nr:reverse transcriptase [Quillaja saponaria]
MTIILLFLKLKGSIKDSVPKHQIDSLQQKEPSYDNLTAEHNLKVELDEWLLREEILWRQKSRVQWLEQEQRNWISRQEDIGQASVDHFSDIFMTSNPIFPADLNNLFSPCISEEDNAFLCAIPDEEEIRSTIFSMNSNKAPGPDGLSALFYKHYWPIIHLEVVKGVQHFFMHGYMLRELNLTNIALIPKSASAHMVNHFRPISLCNVVYKCISKIIANRLKPFLPTIISPLQSAFVKGRQINDNNIIVHEIFHSMKKMNGRNGVMALKIDMEKAFDRVEWHLIISLFRNLGFCDKWGVKISRGGPEFSHLLFAEDLLIFSKVYQRQVDTIQGILNTYCLWEDFTAKYLGIPLSIQRSKKATFSEAINRVQTKVVGWKAHYLSKAGRTTLIKAVGQVVPHYTSQTLLLPNLVTKEMNCMLIKFWWEVNQDTKKALYLQAWDKICMPKSYGGLGIRRIQDTNRAQLAKIGWRILNEPKSLWVQVLKHKYFRDHSFLDSSYSRGSSWLWHGISLSKDLVAKGACVQIGDGKDTSYGVIHVFLKQTISIFILMVLLGLDS